MTLTDSSTVGARISRIRSMFDSLMGDAGDMLQHYLKANTVPGIQELFPQPPEALTVRLGKSLESVHSELDALHLQLTGLKQAVAAESLRQHQANRMPTSPNTESANDIAEIPQVTEDNQEIDLDEWLGL